MLHKQKVRARPVHIQDKLNELQKITKERRQVLFDQPLGLEPGFEIMLGYPGSVTLLTDDRQKFTILISTDSWSNLSPRWQVKAAEEEGTVLLRRNLVTLSPDEQELLRWYVATPPSAVWIARSTALAIVNRAREALGAPVLLELSRGRLHDAMNDPLSCSLRDVLPHIKVGPGSALGMGVEQAEKVAKAFGTETSPTSSSEGHEVRLPPELKQFIFYFDDSLYPDLVSG